MSNEHVTIYDSDLNSNRFIGKEEGNLFSFRFEKDRRHHLNKDDSQDVSMTPTSYFIYLPSLIASRPVTRREIFLFHWNRNIFCDCAVWAPLRWPAVMTPSMRIKSGLIFKCSNKLLGAKSGTQCSMSILRQVPHHSPVVSIPSDLLWGAGCFRLMSVSVLPVPASPRLLFPTRSPGNVFLWRLLDWGRSSKTNGQGWTCWNVSLKKIGREGFQLKLRVIAP